MLERADRRTVPTAPKEAVKAHYEQESCGARYGDSAERVAFYQEIERARYEQDYMIKDFAQFETARGKRVLEVGLGTGTDFIQWCRAGAEAYGRDLTEAAVGHVNERLQLEGLTADVGMGDAEALDFPDNYFDIYYSWGVLMYPDTERAIAEAHRVLKPGGVMKIMLYNHDSVAAFLIWTLYGPLRMRRGTAREIFARQVEGVGTRIYSRDEVERMVRSSFKKSSVDIQTYLSSGDLLSHRPSAKYSGRMWRTLIRVYPRWFVRHILGHRFGLHMTISVTK